MTTAYFIGTSLTLGYDESWVANGNAGSHAYPLAMGARMGWTPIVDGVGGSGYIGIIPYPTFASRLASLIAANPDVVVVEGGVNDFPDLSPATLSAVMVAATTFLSSVRAALPNVKLYVTASESRNDAFVAAMTTLVDSLGGVFVDWKGWLTGTGNITYPAGDGNQDAYIFEYPHPSVAGYRYVGTRFAFAIRPPSTGLV